MEWWSLRIFKGFRTQTTNWRIFLSKWSWSDECWFFPTYVLGFRTHVGATTVCTTVGVHTLTCLHAHFSAHSSCTVILAHLHACAHTRMAQACQQGVCTCVVSLHLAFSLLMSHSSLLFLHGHFETTPDLRPHWRSRPHVLAELSHNEKRRTCATPHMHREVWLPGQVRSKHRLWAQRVRQDHFRGWWHDAHQRSEPQFLRCLENHEREHWTIRCSHSVWILCFARFSKVILLFKWKAKKACIGKPVARRREWEEREGFAIRVA